MRTGPVVSVVIPHHGDPEPTLALLDHLRTQVSAPHLVVVDDASAIPFPEAEGTRIVRRDRNGGFGSAVNSGAEVALGDLMLVLNSDLQIPEDLIARLLDAHERYPRAVLSPCVLDSQGNRVWVGRDFPRIHHQVVEWLTPLARWRNTTAWHRGVGHDVRAPHTDAIVDWVMGAAMLIPLHDFREVGGFDERFFMNCEEIDLQRRLRERGLVSVALASPDVMHVGGGSSPRHQRRKWLVESRLKYAAKWGSLWPLQVALVAATLVNLIVNAGRRLLGRDIQPLAIAQQEMQLIRWQK